MAGGDVIVLTLTGGVAEAVATHAGATTVADVPDTITGATELAVAIPAGTLGEAPYGAPIG